MCECMCYDMEGVQNSRGFEIGDLSLVVTAGMVGPLAKVDNPFRNFVPVGPMIPLSVVISPKVMLRRMGEAVQV